MKPGWTLFLTLLSLPVAAFCVFAYFNFSVSRPNYSADQSDKTLVSFTVRSGEKVYEIAQHLEEQKLINSASLFKIYVRLNNLPGQLQAGNYKMARTLSLVEVVSLLRHGTFDVRLTFPEGWRREQMLEAISSVFKGQNRNFESQDFLERTKSLEGYLFPDTYVVPLDIKTADLVDLMKNNFENKFDRRMRDDLNKQGLNLDQAVILASIVEREANRDEDRPVVAGILIKRLKANWPLDADATIQYALAGRSTSGGDWWPKVLTAEDLLVDSPYNTRKRAGLPPGPISNPGLLSLKAVVYALETPYWFYLTDRSRLTHYAKTLGDHEDNISRYLP